MATCTANSRRSIRLGGRRHVAVTRSTQVCREGTPQGTVILDDQKTHDGFPFLAWSPGAASFSEPGR